MFTSLILLVDNCPLLLRIVFAFVAAFVPVLFWLWFWGHEDKHPEPRRLVALAFLAGMIGVIISLPLEQIVIDRTGDSRLILLLWAAIEEIIKFAGAYIVVLKRSDNDEPVDNMMYMITVALGFSALENAFFLLKPMYYGQAFEALVTGNMRFIGASLLHIVTSGIVGFALALSFYKPKRVRSLYTAIGLITSIALHTAFNLSIITLDESYSIIPFYLVWIAIICIILAFEKVKTITKPIL